MDFLKRADGLSLIEIMIGVALIAILAGIGFIVSNPAGQIAGARNTERSLHLQAVMNAIRQNMADHTGQVFSCASGALPTSTAKMATGAGNYDIASCIVPTYIITMPFDPAASSSHYASNADYDTGYNVLYNASTTQITLSAPSAELGKSVSLTQ